MSGEVSCPLEGRQVGVSVLKTLRSLSPITWLMRVPLASWIGECQRGSWAFMSLRQWGGRG